MMDPERWQRLRTILEGAFETPPEQHDAFLDRACGGDDELRRELDALLAAEASAPPLEDQVAGLAGAMAADRAPETDPLIGALVDRYRVLQLLGQGGMATVYLAARADDQYKQRVALKLIRGADSEELLVRFRTERQILAGLEHPNIARLLDAGRIPADTAVPELADRPYMVMEYVEGLPIDRYCDRHRLTIRERISLFHTVCQTVQHAHQNLVVHRDLKPGNILVTDEGVVKLLDFGIAKVLNPDLSSAAMALTRADLRLLSPSYASPEQILGEVITTSSDVYSLGVVLFELLTGRLPHLPDGDAPALIRRILQLDPTLPSAVVATPPAAAGAAPPPSAVAHLRGTTPKHLHRQLRGDLDAVVLHALAKEPRRRYRTAEHLGQDLHRFLAGKPLAARKATAAYRLRKLVRRHALAVAAVVLGAGAVLAALAGAVQQARLAAAAQERAERQAATAARISEFLVEVFAGASPSSLRGEPITARELLDQGARRIDAELAGSPEVQAALMDVMGRAYMSQGLYEPATPLLERALALRRQLHPEGHLDVALSQRQLGRVLGGRGQPARAAPLLQASLATLRRVVGDEHPEVVDGLRMLSYAVGMLGDDRQAEALRRESLALARRLWGGEHPAVAQALNDLGQVLVRRGRAREAEAALREALTIRRAVFGDIHPDMATSTRNLAAALLEMDRLEEAEAAAREAIAVCRRVQEARHPKLAQSFEILARVLIERRRLDEAEALAGEALAIFRAANPEGQTRTVLAIGVLAEIELARGRVEAAAARVQEAMDLMQRVTPPAHVATAQVRGLYGRSLAAQGRMEEAETELLAALRVLEARQVPASLALRRTRAVLAALAEARGDLDAAARYRAAPGEPPPPS